MIFRPLIVVEIEATTNETSVLFLFFYIKKKRMISHSPFTGKTKKKGSKRRGMD
jgi:hypothetical protein